MSVRFTLVDRQLKLFKHGLQALQKIGSELLLEALPARIVLRTINSSLSAYLSVTYNAGFFDAYDVLDCNVVQAGLLMKHVLSVFRTQRVDKILFDLSTVTCKATITLHCENGLTKSYKLPTMDSEILQATVDKQQFAVRITAETAAFSRLLASFHSGLEEVTLVALPDGSHRPVHVNSFIDPQKGHMDKSLYTSVQVEPSETFVSFVNSADEVTDVTINLKDFKAMLGLCENLGVQIRLWFDSPGNPLVAEPHFPHTQGQEVDYEAELILSTLMESHAGPAAAEAAATAVRGAAAAGPAANGIHTPGGGGVETPMADGGGCSSGRSGGRSAQTGELGLSPAPGLTGRHFPGATVARPQSAGAAGPSRFGQEAQQQQPGQHPAHQQQQSGQQQQQLGQAAAPAQSPRPSGLVDDGSLWARSGDRGQQQSELNPLGGDAGPMHMEQDEVSWEEEEALPLSLPPPGAPMSTLPPGAIM
ncbi:Cell cycle checkpoint control RAD9A [Chlorella sorokiniana]|uniref:Cell cycle checkpoint control RAD9A n=1 Tax=Chlorella sorokiniana TaxID=3076 RepID=A0A2P6U5M6_CHLSO|nr:Cell cycle checkpoint control RAD9A [Chlorella sorokiniana]|eukprot:PRW61626.1 Cell cycle checkpoint control RAD9A [Chlorella sorokiniana]